MLAALDPELERHPAVLASGGLDPFAIGLYGCSEMVNEGFKRLVETGVIRRKVVDDEALMRRIADGTANLGDQARLERDVTRARGEMEQAGAQIARIQAAISEATRKIQETDLSFKNEARKELSDVLGKLNALNQGAAALVDKVDKSSVKSPVRGRVQRLRQGFVRLPAMRGSPEMITSRRSKSTGLTLASGGNASKEMLIPGASSAISESNLLVICVST